MPVRVDRYFEPKLKEILYSCLRARNVASVWRRLFGSWESTIYDCYEMWIGVLEDDGKG